jgi:hypothetical protein
VSRVAALAMKRGKSVDFTGYWQRHIADSSAAASAGMVAPFTLATPPEPPPVAFLL